MELDKYRDYLRKQLSKKRFYHSECVEKESISLAKEYNADIPRVAKAALLHDICKEMPLDSQLKYLKSCDILLDDTVIDNPFIWHGITGSYFIQKELGVTDKQIIDAVKHHTTARAEMSLTEEIIFLADYISEDRTYPDVDKLRDYVKIGKEFAIVKCLEFGLIKCLEKNSALVKSSVEAYNYYLLQQKKV